MIIVDSHCHLNFPEFQDKLEQIVENANNANVKYMQTICTELEEMPALIDIADRYDNIFISVGVHPCEVKVKDENLYDKIINYTKHKKVIGLVETGLDLYHDKSNFELQKEYFKIHIEAARETGLPVIIHTRDADQKTLRILEQEIAQKPFKALIHCFTASKEFALSVLDLGLYISISGIVTFKNAVSLQEIAKMIPLDRLLVETDAPYLAPVPKRGQVNEPAYTRHTLEYLAGLRNMEMSELAQITTNNFFKLFDKAKIC